MSLSQAFFSEYLASNSLIIVICYLFTLIVIQLVKLQDNKGILGIGMMVFLHLILVPVAASLHLSGSDYYNEIRLALLTIGAMAMISMACLLFFRVLLYKLHIQTPRILQDLIIAGATIIAFFALASKSGYNLSGLIATSAVLTAVIGFSLQDTLGNIMGGLALQMDNSVKLGDWIKLDNNQAGRVIEIRWRYTAIETRNWETLIIPNSALMKGQVMILGRRTDKPHQWRRWVYFNVDFRYSPTEVIRVVSDALRQADIENIAIVPAINCILMDLSDSFGRYAVRYWLTDLAVDDPTDSEVRTWVYFALKRAGIPLSLPAHAIFVTEESSDRKEQKSKAEIKHRTECLAGIELFNHLPDDVLQFLAGRLHNAPFTEGEIITRQGADAHWLYIIIEGMVSIHVAVENGSESEVAKLGPGSFFGEMALMTGEKRSATVIALTDVLCYRLEKAAFKEIIHQKPEIADNLARILAKRRTELDSVRDNLDHNLHASKLEDNRIHILGKIRDFFGLSEHHLK